MPLIPKNTKIKDSDNSPYRNKILFRLVQATAWCKQPLGASNRLVQAAAWCKQQSTKKGRFSPAFFNSDH
jgi:hypothetical protein